ncbi:DUF2267 domain-containing protein [Micromonospora parathelypteridis]|uniref:Uncharacterized protein (DUF2267 family) n=1 Tax=Micromonospora parathelypteridis TaxID=1839617 RepID=A0A840WAK0_9ACTN|nr:DUF2267 domain-containing protein [Micromonospora parathelypteridis]MBB5481129.1 uncharacterized protein (DUF2267 family) [Micromonospora parathelypteridis]
MTDSAGGDGFPHFIDAVSRRSGLPTEQAAALARAVLQTMAERVTGGPPDALAWHLPNNVGGYLTGPTPDPAGAVGPDLGVGPYVGGGPEPGVGGLDTGVDLEVGGAAAPPPPADAGPADFLRRVGQRAGVDPATARAGTGAVFATLREAMTVREFREMVARLPRDDDGGGPAPVPPDPYLF